jgi:hypothetical protein
LPLSKSTSSTSKREILQFFIFCAFLDPDPHRNAAWQWQCTGVLLFLPSKLVSPLIFSFYCLQLTRAVALYSEPHLIVIQIGSCIRIRNRNPVLYPNSDIRRQKGTQKKKKMESRSNRVLPFITICQCIFLRNIFSGGPEADAVRIFLPRIGKQGAT